MGLLDLQREINLVIFHLNYILIHVNILPYSVLNWEYLKISELGTTLMTVSIFSLQYIILISWQNYCLQTRVITCMCQRSVCMCYKKSGQLYIFGSSFILSLRSRGNMEQALLYHLISSYQQNSVISYF